MHWLITAAFVLFLSSAVVADEPKVRRPEGAPNPSISNYIQGQTLCSMETKTSCNHSPWCTRTSRRCAPLCNSAFPYDIYEGSSDVTALWCLDPDQWDCCVKEVAAKPPQETKPPPQETKPRRVGSLINVSWQGGKVGFCANTRCENGERRCMPGSPDKCVRDCRDDDAFPNESGTWCKGDDCCARVQRSLIPGKPREARKISENVGKCGNRICKNTEWCHPTRNTCLPPCFVLNSPDRQRGPGVWCKGNVRGFHPNTCCVNM